MADIAIVASEVAPAPQQYTLPGAQEILLKAVGCTVNGTSASGSFLPALQMLDPAGHIMWTAVNRADPVAAGASALVSWFPGGGVDQLTGTSSSSSSSGGITAISSPNSTLTVGHPNGPTANLDMPATGVTAATYGDNLTVPQITVDAEGRLTGAANVAIASGAGGGFVQVSQVIVTSGDQTTTGTSFADAAGLTTTITTGAHRCLVIFSAMAKVSATGGNSAFDLAIDGSRQGGAYGLSIVGSPNSGSGNSSQVGWTYLTASLSAASHTFKIQWRVDSGTGTMFASAGVTPAILTVMELGI